MLPTNATLLVIDVQEAFRDASWGPRNNPDAEQIIARLIMTWRQTGRPVVHVHHSSRSPDGLFFRGRPGHEPRHEALPIEGEPIYLKAVNSSFIGTGLEQDLRNANVDTLVLVGLTTNHCVSTTARMAGNLGFDTYVVKDATAAFDRMGLDDRIRPAEEVHQSALSDLAEEFATVIGSDDLVDLLTRKAPDAA